MQPVAPNVGTGPLIVSILTRPEGRVQRAPGRCCLREAEVSILTRPEGRVQPGIAGDYAASGTRFNPHPARRPGATGRDAPATAAESAFQSSPGQKAGCNRLPSRECPDRDGFNPHPARRPGATVLVLPDKSRGFLRFQSSPGQKAGCNRNVLRIGGGYNQFQSSPGQKAGCNGNIRRWQGVQLNGFQSSPGQKAGCNSCI